MYSFVCNRVVTMFVLQLWLEINQMKIKNQISLTEK